MAEPSSAARAKPLHGGLPDEIVLWEILVRLPPESLLRCRAVCRAWRLATSARDFLLAHHRRQPSLPILCSREYGGADHENILVLDHRVAEAQLQPVVRLDETFYLKASCDGLLILSKYDMRGVCLFSVYNPATRQRAPLRQLSGLSLLGMYLHRPTSEYRLLMHSTSSCYVFALGSDQQPRFIGAQEPHSTECVCFRPSALVRDSLHWCPVRGLVLVFSTTSESFSHMRAPVVSTSSYIFETNDTLGIYSYDDAMKIVDIWVLQSYESEVWDYKYRVQVPAERIRGQLGWQHEYWDVKVVSGDSDVLVMVIYGQWLCYVHINGELVASFRRDGKDLHVCQRRLKQTLVQHTFFTALEGYAVNASPFRLTAIE